MTIERSVGLLGAGYILKSHALALQALPGLRLQAVCDLSRGRAQAAADEFGIPEVLASIEALAQSSCEVVHILLPPHLHVSAARTLIEAGKHVFIEKPMGVSAAECRELAALAEARGVRLAVNHNFLFSPAYQAVRDGVRSGRFGPVDTLQANWLYALPLLAFGPFNNWMMARPGNLVFELGPHLAAFVVDLMGPVTVTAAIASNPADLPGEQRVYRRWQALVEGRSGAGALTLSLSPGQTDRSVSVRTLGGMIRFDFEKGLVTSEAQRSDNPIFDNVANARRTARALGRAAVGSFGRYLGRAVRKRAAANPFEESILLSIEAFYRSFEGPVDERLTGRFGAEVIALCEAIVARTGVESDVRPAGAASAAVPAPSATVLVVGGTGFIGRRLVERLAARGIGVRVLTRSTAAARIELGQLPVELMQGGHGDAETLTRALAGIDTVYHLAKAEGKRWQDYLDNDVEPTRRLAEAAAAAGVRRFIYTGTIDSYASADPAARITGDTPLDPAIRRRNNYARSKAECEAVLRGIERRTGMPVVVLRPGIVIGAGSPPAHYGVGRFVSPTHVEYWGDGRNKLPFVLVDDVAEALALAYDAAGIEGMNLLVTDAPLLSARDYVAAVERRAGAAVAGEPRPIWRYWLEGAVKEGMKHLMRHRNRGVNSRHDWACRAHRSRYDASGTEAALGWKPAGTAVALTARGIEASVDRFMS